MFRDEMGAPLKIRPKLHLIVVKGPSLEPSIVLDEEDRLLFPDIRKSYLRITRRGKVQRSKGNQS